MKFGERRVCDQLVERIRERVEELNAEKSLANKVKQRADLLNGKVQYRHESDAIPMREELAEITLKEDGKKPPIRVNVLADDYWDLEDVLV